MIMIGTRCQLEQVVTEELTAAKIGSGLLPVFGTPYLAAMMENAAQTLLQAFLEEGKGSVGTHLDISHDAPTPIGMKVWAEALLTEMDGKRLVFEVTAYDEAGLIGRGSHERFIINTEKFLAKCEAKKQK